jgi:hypothetical protein
MTKTQFESLISVWDLDRPDCLPHLRTVAAGVFGAKRGKKAGDRDRGWLYIIQQLRNADTVELYCVEPAAFETLLRDAFLKNEWVNGVDVWLFGLPDSVATIGRIIHDPLTYRDFQLRPQINFVEFNPTK